MAVPNIPPFKGGSDPSGSIPWRHDAERRSLASAGLPDSWIRTSRRPVSNHPSRLRELVYVVSSFPSRSPLSLRGWASPVANRLAIATGRIEFTCVTGRRFTSGCSPHGLAAAQLPSINERTTRVRRGLPPRRSDTLSGALARASCPCLKCWTKKTAFCRYFSICTANTGWKPVPRLRF